jgi:hypothetical protein
VDSNTDGVNSKTMLLFVWITPKMNQLFPL